MLHLPHHPPCLAVTILAIGSSVVWRVSVRNDFEQTQWAWRSTPMNLGVPNPASCRLTGLHAQVRHPFVWRFGYNLQQPRLMHISSQSMAAMASTQMINAMLDEYRPDLVVSVHPLMQQFPLHVLKHRIRCPPLSMLTPHLLARLLILFFCFLTTIRCLVVLVHPLMQQFPLHVLKHRRLVPCADQVQAVQGLSGSATQPSLRTSLVAHVGLYLWQPLPHVLVHPPRAPL